MSENVERKMETKIVLPKIEYNRCRKKIDVTQGSPRKLRVACRKIAEFFRREGGYDFVQFDENETDEYHAFLFFDPLDGGDEVIGACCFRWREWTNSDPGWGLQWIWLHPYFRGKGILKGHWPFFMEKFGNFSVEGPVSRIMFDFLKKYYPQGL